MSATGGSVEGIFISPEFEQLPEPVDEVEVVPGKGIRGDRYFVAEGRDSAGEEAGHDLTLIEAEALEALEAEQGIELTAADRGAMSSPAESGSTTWWASASGSARSSARGSSCASPATTSRA